jgi:transcriptional regulator of met regulon
MRWLRTPKKALDRDHQIGPHRLRTGIAAPYTAGDRREKKQRERGEHKQPSDVVEFLRPNFEKEKVEAARRKIDQDRLIGKIRTAMPAQPWYEVVDRERDRHDDPLDGAKGAVRALGIDLDAGGIEGRIDAAVINCRRIASLDTGSRLAGDHGSGLERHALRIASRILHQHLFERTGYSPPPSA